VNNELRDIGWTRDGQKNSVAVIDAVNQSVGFKLPVEDMYMRRLREYKKQVLPIKYPTCPLGWEKHTSNPKASNEMGVAWITEDGYFCGPPGVEESTRYRENDPTYNSATALNKRVRDLTTEIRQTLSPEDYKEDISKKKERKQKHKDAFEKSQKARKAALQKETETERKRNVAKIEKIMNDHGFDTAAANKTEAQLLFTQAKACVEGNGETVTGCKLVKDTSDRSKHIHYHIPENLYIPAGETAGPMQMKLLEWWRSFRRAHAAKKVLEERKSLAMYL